MAGRTGRAESGKLSSHVARRACRRGVLAGQWELGGVVVECRTGPLGCRVTGFACLRESGGYVIRVGCALEVGQVARGACRSKSGESTCNVTGGARGARVLTG